MRPRLIAYAAGAALVMLGCYGILTTTSISPVGWALWFGGLAVVHDLVLVPLVLVVALLVGRVAEPYRSSVTRTLIIAGAVTVVALPLVFGFGRRADDPSQLPLNYPANLALVLSAVATVSAITLVLRATRARRAGRQKMNVPPEGGRRQQQ
jgi:hypothetical protein